MIRKIRKSELSELLELYSHMHTQDDPLPNKHRIDEVWEIIQNDLKLHYFVLDHENQILSTCHLIIVPNLSRGSRPYGLIENVVTHKRYRKRGFGKAVLLHTLRYAWDNGCYTVMLLTGRTSDAVFRFYESVGFSRHGKQAFIAKP